MAVNTWTRAWAMPHHETFQMKPVAELVHRYLRKSKVSVDPFARNNRWSTVTNDIDPGTDADYHMDAAKFLEKLRADKVHPDLVLFDPPYSPRQISEHYKSIGVKATRSDTQNVRRKKERMIIANMQPIGGIVISFGWNTTGMGKWLGYEIIEGLIVNHGSAHNDTLCVVEKKIQWEAETL